MEDDRMNRIDALADRKLKLAGEDRPATEVWDEARDEVDAADRERFKRDTAATQAMIADMERDGLL